MSKLYPKLQTGGLFQTNQKAYSDSVLLANKDKDWVRRLYEKNTPKIYINGDNVPSTHYMGDNGKGYVFPTIVRENGILKNLNDSTSFTPEQYARKTNTGIQLPVKQGSWFAANGYKKGTGVLNEFQQGGTLSQLGYKRHSPYNKASSLLIHTPTGSITMKEVDHPIIGISKGEIKFMLPNQEYQFKSNKVLEIPLKTMYKSGGRISSKSKMYPKCKCGCRGVSVGKNKMFQQGGTMDVLDGDGNSQMTITGGERIFSRIATKRMRQLNEEGNYTELGKFICDELYAQDKRDPQYVKE